MKTGLSAFLLARALRLQHHHRDNHQLTVCKEGPVLIPCCPKQLLVAIKLQLFLPYWSLCCRALAGWAAIGWLDLSICTTFSLPGLGLALNGLARAAHSFFPASAPHGSSFGWAGLEGWVSQLVWADPWMVFPCLDEHRGRKKVQIMGKWWEPPSMSQLLKLSPLDCVRCLFQKP